MSWLIGDSRSVYNRGIKFMIQRNSKAVYSRGRSISAHDKQQVHEQQRHRHPRSRKQGCVQQRHMERRRNKKMFVKRRSLEQIFQSYSEYTVFYCACLIRPSFILLIWSLFFLLELFCKRIVEI